MCLQLLHRPCLVSLQLKERKKPILVSDKKGCHLCHNTFSDPDVVCLPGGVPVHVHCVAHRVKDSPTKRHLTNSSNHTWDATTEPADAPTPPSHHYQLIASPGGDSWPRRAERLDDPGGKSTEPSTVAAAVESKGKKQTTPPLCESARRPSGRIPVLPL